MNPELINPVEKLFIRNDVDNISWIDLGDFIVVIDALEQKSLKNEVFQMIAKTCPDKPIKYLINTHDHYDHTALNPDFISLGAKLIALPDYDSKTITGTNGITLQFIPFPGCHTKHDAIVFSPELNTLFTGDIFGWGLIPWEGKLTTDKVNHLKTSYQKLIDFNAKIVIPGHGPIATTVELERWLEYFNDLLDKKKAGKLDQSEPPPADMLNWWRFTDWKHQDTLKRIINRATL